MYSCAVISSITLYRVLCRITAVDILFGVQRSPFLSLASPRVHGRVLAPLTDLVCRMICRRHAASLSQGYGESQGSAKNGNLLIGGASFLFLRFDFSSTRALEFLACYSFTGQYRLQL